MSRRACVCPGVGCPMARNPARPTVVMATPAQIGFMLGCGSFAFPRRTQAMRTANSRSQTSNGCTSARLP
jgi:hypothetical protein